MKNNLPMKMKLKMQSIVLSKEQAQIFAAAIRPQIKAYIKKNRDKYEAWLQAENKKTKTPKG